MADVLEALFPFKWREVELPISRTRMSIAHDLVEHKYWGFDGARIEDTGLAPTRIHATIPLHKGVVPGKAERWSQPYPTLLRALVLSFSKREKGKLQHPEFGGMICRAEHLEIDWDAMRRGGCDAEASWVETADDDATVVGANTLPTARAEEAAQSLDSIKADIKQLVPKAPEYEESFESMMNSFSGAVDQVALGSQRFAGRIDAVAYRVTALGDSIGRARNALTWRATDAIERLKSAANDTRAAMTSPVGSKRVGIYVVRVDTTLATLLARLPGAKLIDLIRLNPGIMRQPIVKARTIVRYYREAIAA